MPDAQRTGSWSGRAEGHQDRLHQFPRHDSTCSAKTRNDHVPPFAALCSRHRPRDGSSQCRAYASDSSDSVKSPPYSRPRFDSGRWRSSPMTSCSTAMTAVLLSSAEPAPGAFCEAEISCYLAVFIENSIRTIDSAHQKGIKDRHQEYRIPYSEFVTSQTGPPRCADRNAAYDTRYFTISTSGRSQLGSGRAEVRRCRASSSMRSADRSSGVP